MPRELPGFYYDAEKGKYFRIQKSHLVVSRSQGDAGGASGSGGQHTSQSIKATTQAQENRRRDENRIRRHRHGKINRSSLLLHTTSPLMSRLGGTPQSNLSSIRRQYSAGLSRCDLDGYGPPYSPDEGFLGSSFHITRAGVLHATYNNWSRTDPNIDNSFIFRPFGSRNPADKATNKDAGDLPTHLSFVNHYQRFPRNANIIVSVYDSAPSHSAYFPASVAAATTTATLESSTDFEQAIVLTDGSPTITIKPVNPARRHPDYISLEINLATRNVGTIWDMAAAPDNPRIAIATDAGLTIARIGNNNVNSVLAPRDLVGKEQMNVAFKDSHTVISAERSGRVNLSDSRVAESVLRLWHSSAVLGCLSMRQGNQILVHGYSTTSIYDLRFTGRPSLQQLQQQQNNGQQGQHKNQKKQQQQRHSRPYIDFSVPRDRWSDHYTYGRKVVYSSDLDLVIAASANASSLPPTSSLHPSRVIQSPASYVTLYDASTGRVVDGPLTRHRYVEDVTCLDVRRVRDGVESVFCLVGGCLEEWSVGRMGEDDWG